MKTRTLNQRSKPVPFLRTAQAASPETSPERLRALAVPPAPPKRLRAITRNPNAPVDLLFSLGALYPSELLANPLWSLLFLESPQRPLPPELLRAFATLPEFPLAALEAASVSDSALVLSRVLRHPHASLAQLQSAISRVEQEHLLALAENPRVPSSVFVAVVPRLWAAQSSQDALFYEALLRRDDLPGEIIAAVLSRCGSRGIRRRALLHPAVPEAALQQVAESRDYEMRRAVALNKTCPPSLLSRLLWDDAEEVRAAVLRHPALPEDERRRFQRAEAHKVSPEELLLLADAESPFARSLAARAPQTPPGVLARLVRDPARVVRRALAENPAAPHELLWDLLRRELPEHSLPPNAGDVALALARNEGAPLDLLLHLARGPAVLRLALAERARGPAEVLDLLARASSLALRRAVAKHPGAWGETLARLEHDQDWLVRAALAENPATPSGVIARLCEDAHEHVRTRALSRGVR